MQCTLEDIGAISPFVSHAVSLAIEGQRLLDRKLGTKAGEVTIPRLETLREHLSKRWSFRF